MLQLDKISFRIFLYDVEVGGNFPCQRSLEINDFLAPGSPSVSTLSKF